MRCACSRSHSPTKLANFLRSLVLPNEVAQWSLTTLREKLVKIGARIVRHGRYVIFQLARGGGAASALRRDPAPHRPAAGITGAGDVTVRTP
jgi:regulation of enolase protein 1 (concanavalin A-like superfamily)